MKRFGFLVFVFFASILPCSAYTDTTGSDFEEAINVLTGYGLVEGYEDGSFQPDASINRAELAKLLVSALGADLTRGGCFEDVSDEWFAPFVCAAQESGWVSGYESREFLPANPVTLVEAAKMVANAFAVSLVEPSGSAWYSAYLETLIAHGVIPSSLNYTTESVNRGEAVEMVWRLLGGQTSENALTLNQVNDAVCVEEEIVSYTDLDLERVRDAWFEWTNSARASQGLPAYGHEPQLDRTALIWSETSLARGYMNHKRDGTTAYYDYWAIQSWFSELGVNFSGSGTVFVENIGHGPYSCDDTECTDELLEAIYYTFDYFMSEAGSSYRPHYNSIMSSTYDVIGFGIVVTDSEYYLTVHYGTALSSSPAAFCDE